MELASASDLKVPQPPTLNFVLGTPAKYSMFQDAESAENNNTEPDIGNVVDEIRRHQSQQQAGHQPLPNSEIVGASISTQIAGVGPGGARLPNINENMSETTSNAAIIQGNLLNRRPEGD